MPLALFHRELGGPGLPPILILHGMLGSSRNWQTAGRDLAGPGGRRVAALDLRNHGNSPHDASMTYADMEADVLAWIEAQQIGRAILVGHSMGGKVAMGLACRHPERVERLVVVDIAPKAYYRVSHRAEFVAMNELDLSHLASRGEAELRMEGRVPDWAMRKFLTTNLERAEGGGWRWTVNLAVLSAALPALESNPLARGDHFDGPALFVAGSRSNYVAESDRASIRAHFPAAKVTVLTGCGHNPHIEARERFVDQVLAFLG